MKQCINMALNLPDFSNREKDGKYVHIKHFKFSVGHLGFAKRPSNKIKVVFGIEQHHSIVVSAFPCTRKFINIFKIKNASSIRKK